MKNIFLSIAMLIGFSCWGQKKDSVWVYLNAKDSFLATAWTTASAIRGTLTITPKQDTVRCIMLVCDTAKITSDLYTRLGGKFFYQTNLWWQFGYEVREYNTDLTFQVCDWDNVWGNYCIRSRLDQNKKPLSKSIIVWISKEIKQ